MGAAALAHRATERYLNYEIITGRPHKWPSRAARVRRHLVGSLGGPLLLQRSVCALERVGCWVDLPLLRRRVRRATYRALACVRVRARARLHATQTGGARRRNPSDVCMYGDSSEGRDLFEDFLGDDMAACEDGAEPAAQRSVDRFDDGNRMDGWASANEQPNVRAAEAPACPSEAE